MKVLIVDDERIEREGVKYLLSLGMWNLRSIQWEAGNGDTSFEVGRFASYGYKNAAYGWSGIVQKIKGRKCES